MITERELQQLFGFPGVPFNIETWAYYFSHVLGRTVTVVEALDAIDRINQRLGDLGTKGPTIGEIKRSDIPHWRSSR